MKLNNLAAIATIVGAVFAGASYFSGSNDTSGTGSPSNELEQRADEIELTLDIPVYSGERNWLAAMFKAADGMPTYAAQQKGLKKVVVAALDVDDINIALMAALEMPTYASRAEMLDLIVDKAVQSKTTLDYAYFAANKYPTYAGKEKGLSKVIDAYAKVIKKQQTADPIIETEQSETMHNKSSKRDAVNGAPS